MSIGPLLRDWRTAPPPQPARPRARGGRLHPPPELRRDRPLAAQRGACCCTSPSTSRCRCASATGCCSPPATRRATRERALDEPEMAPGRATRCERVLDGARAVSRRSPSTARWDARRRQRRGRRCSSPASRRELLAPPVNVLRVEPAPRRPGAAHREPRASGARTCSSALRRQVARDRRPGARRAARRAGGLPGRRAPAPEPRRAAATSSCRCACAPTAASCRSSAPHHVRHARSTSRVAELAIESFFPADERTAAVLRSA